MNSTDPLTRAVTIQNQRGLHARAAAKFVQVVARFPNARVLVEKDGQSVGGESIMGLMMLGGTQGSQILISASGPDAQDVLDAISALVDDRFGEPE